MNRNLIAGMGEVLWDVLPEGKKMGGAPANFAYHVSQFGLDSCVISAVGKDELGDEILHILNDKRLQAELSVVDYPTGTVQVSLNVEGVPQYNIKEGVAWDNIPFSKRLHDIALRTRAVCFGSLAQRNAVSRVTINRFLDTIPDHDGLLKIFDINLRQQFYTKEIIINSLQKCNVLKINDEELMVVSRLFGYEDIPFAEQCRSIISAYNLNLLILTCGTDGSYVFTRNAMSFKSTPRVNVVDTVGAGDSFTAAFCAAIIKGHSVAEAHQRAVDISAYVCTQSGAMPRLPESLQF